jgi:Uncharacterized conserved protein
MDFKDMITQLGQRVEKLKENMPTEEATKNALILPMISALGYNVFDPTEVLPEFICDIGTKKGEKIDYAIMQDGKPVILIECKHWQQDLTLHDNQLLRYFNVSSAKFGVLTNGIKYRFYTDLQEKNKMDEVPFLEIDIQELNESKIQELKKFHKSYFDVDNVLSTANELKYLGELRLIIQSEFSKPSDDFVRFFGKRVYNGVLTQRVVEELSPLVKRSIDNYVNEIIAERLKVAIDKNPDQKQDNEQQREEGMTEHESDIVTTEEELEGFYICKAILSRVLASERISYKDRKDYFAIIIDNKVTRTICRLRFNYNEIRRVSFVNEDKTETDIDLMNGNISDLYNYEDKLLEIAKRFL